jgi:hypothetical protein
MKINKFYILLSFLTIAFTLVSCSNVLDSSPAGRITLDDIFSNNDKVSAFLNTCYASIPNQQGLFYDDWCRGPVDWCDDAWDSEIINVPRSASAHLYNGTISAGNNTIITDSGVDYWNVYWTSIRNCNIFLANIKHATVNSENDRNRWTAEAYVLRAYYYSELLKWYGCALPIETAPYSFTQDYSQIKRSSYYDVVKFIIANCDSALNNPALPWRITTPAESSRVQKAMAEAIKSRMILFAASPLYNDGVNHWDEAYTIDKDALTQLKANGYALYNSVNFPATYLSPDAYLPNNYAALYNEYFTNSMQYTSNPIDKETIYQNPYAANDPIYTQDGIGAQGTKSGTCPSQELVDAFETTDGQPILNLANPYLDEKHTQPNYNPNNTLYNPNNPYAKRDPRFYAEIYYNGSIRKAYWPFAETKASIENYPAAAGYRARIIATWVGEPKTGIQATGKWMDTYTGYFERKFLAPNSGNDTHKVMAAATKVFRLGEVILNFAEAAAEDNHLDEATEAVNEIRERVGMPDIPSGLSQSDLILRIHNERRVELCMEENRYFDVRRWTSPTGDLSSTDKWITAMFITRNSNGTFTYNRAPVQSNPRLCYTNNYLKLPLDLNEANLLQSLTGETWQNPGW